MLTPSGTATATLEGLSVTTWRDGETALWLANLDRMRDQERSLAGLLSEDERARTGRFILLADRTSFVLRRALLRMVLASCVGTSPTSVRFDYGANGKPRLASGGAHFNMTHSAGRALIAVALRHPVGVDIERVRPVAEAGAIATQFFTPAERRVLESLPHDQRERAFFDCWTRKEAFVKAVGEGLSFPLHDFEVSVGPDLPARLLSIRRDTAAAERWSLHDLAVGDGYSAAFVVDNIT